MYDRVVSGRVVMPDAVVDGGWVAIAGETIGAVGTGSPPDAAEHHDYGDAYLLPGIIDGQTHAGSQFGFAGIGVTTRAAVAGGVTTIVDMPYDEPDPVTTAAILAGKVAAIAEHAHCDVALYGTVATVPDRDDIASLVAGGVCAFKISSFENHPWRFPRIDNASTLMLLEALSGSGLPVGLHNEDQEIVRTATARLREEGKTGAEFHSPSRPEVAELAATATFLEIAASTGAHAHIVHLSVPEGFELVRRYRARGVNATAEMCVHYLHFDGAVDVPRLGALLKVNPPIRSGRRDELWSALEDGDCAFVSSDHSAWPLSRKGSESIFDNAAGVPGLATLLPVFFTDAAARYGADAAARMAAELLSEHVAGFFGLARKGRLSPGFDADIAVLRPGATIYDSARTPDGTGWSPYDGETFAALPVATYVRGRLAWDGSAVIAPAGSGRFARRAEPVDRAWRSKDR